MEIWKDVIGFEGYYQVSNYGNVRSVDRYVDKKNIDSKAFLKGKTIKQHVNNKGYPYVTFYKNSKANRKSVHQIVAESFLNHKSNKYKTVVDHINNNKKDNNVNNLRLLSHRENVSRSMQNKTGFRGVHKSGRGYKALIRINGKRYHLGTFDSAEEASHAYEKAIHRKQV